MGKKRIYSSKKRPFIWPRRKEDSEDSNKRFFRAFSPDITDRQSSRSSHTDLVVVKKESINNTEDSVGGFGAETIVESVSLPRALYSSKGFSPDIITTYRQSRRTGKPMKSSGSSHLDEPVCGDGNHDEEDGQADPPQTLKMVTASAGCTETVKGGNTADVKDMIENVIVECEANDSVIGWSPLAIGMETPLVWNKESHSTEQTERVCAQEHGSMVANGTPRFCCSSGGFSPDITSRQNRWTRRSSTSSGSSDLGEPLGGDGNHEEPDVLMLKRSDEACTARYEETLESHNMETGAHVFKKESSNTQEHDVVCEPEVMVANVARHIISSDIEGLGIATNEQPEEMCSTDVNGIGQGTEDASMIPQFSNGVETECCPSVLSLFQGSILLATGVQSDSESGVKALPQEPDVFILANEKDSKDSTQWSVTTECFDSRHDNSHWIIPSPELLDDYSSSAVAATDDDNNLQSFSPQHWNFYKDCPPVPCSLLVPYEATALASESLTSQEHEETLTVMAIYDSDKSALNAFSCTTDLAAHIPKVCEENCTAEEGDEKPVLNSCDESFHELSEPGHSDHTLSIQCADNNNEHEPREHLISQAVLNYDVIMESNICITEKLPPVSPQHAAVLQAYTAGKECQNKVQNTHLTESSIPVSEMEELVTTSEASFAMLPTDLASTNNGCDCHGNPEREEDMKAGKEIMKAKLSKANIKALKVHKKLYTAEHHSIVYGDRQFVVYRTDLQRDRNRTSNIPLWRIHRKEQFLRKYEPITIDERDCHHGVNVLRQMPRDDDYLVLLFQPVLAFMVIDTRESAVCVVFEVQGSVPLLGYFPASECLFPDFVKMLTKTILTAVSVPSLNLSDSSDKISGLVHYVSNTQCFSLLFPSDLLDALKLNSSMEKKKLTKKSITCITCGRLDIIKPATSTIIVGGQHTVNRNSDLAQKNFWDLCGSCVKYADTFQKLQQFKLRLLMSYRMQLQQLYARLDEGQKYDINDVVQYLRDDSLHNRLLFYEFLTTYFTVIETTKDIEALVQKAGKTSISASADLSRQPASTSNVKSIDKELSEGAVERCEGSKTEVTERKTDNVFRAERRVTKRLVKKRQIYSPPTSPMRKVAGRNTVSKPLDNEDSKSHQSYPKASKTRRTLTERGVLKGPVLPKKECVAHLTDSDVKTGSARPAKRKVTSEVMTRQALTMNAGVALDEASQEGKTDTVRRRQLNSNKRTKPDHGVTQDQITRTNQMSLFILPVSIPLEKLSTEFVNRLHGGSGASSHCTKKKTVRPKFRRR